MIEQVPLLILTDIILSVNIGNIGLYWLYLIISVNTGQYRFTQFSTLVRFNQYLTNIYIIALYGLYNVF